MPNCEKYQDLCSAYLDNALSAQEQELLHAHLQSCPACQAYLQDLQKMQTLWTEMEVPVPKALHEQMMNQIEQEVAKTVVQMPAKQPRRLPVFTMLAAAAACVMLAVSGQLTGLFGQLSMASNSPMQTVQTPTATDKQNDSTQQDVNRQITQTPSVQEQTPQPRVTQAPPAGAQDETLPASEQSPQKPEKPVVQAEEAPVPSSQQAPDSQPSATQSQPEADAPQVAAYGLPQHSRAILSEPPESTQSVLPQALQGLQFARCYQVSGGTAVPELSEMTLLVDENHVQYYSVENNESKLAKVQEALRNNGYEITLDETTVTIQKDAGAVLFVIALPST